MTTMIEEEVGVRFELRKWEEKDDSYEERRDIFVDGRNLGHVTRWRGGDWSTVIRSLAGGHFIHGSGETCALAMRDALGNGIREFRESAMKAVADASAFAIEHGPALVAFLEKFG